MPQRGFHDRTAPPLAPECWVGEDAPHHHLVSGGREYAGPTDGSSGHQRAIDKCPKNGVRQCCGELCTKSVHWAGAFLFKRKPHLHRVFCRHRSPQRREDFRIVCIEWANLCGRDGRFHLVGHGYGFDCSRAMRCLRGVAAMHHDFHCLVDGACRGVDSPLAGATKTAGARDPLLALFTLEWRCRRQVCNPGALQQGANHAGVVDQPQF